MDARTSFVGDTSSLFPPPAEVCIGLGACRAVGMTFGTGNGLITFPATSAEAKKKSLMAGDVARGRPPGSSLPMIEVTWETSLFTPILRKLVNESAQTFLNLQKTSDEEDVISQATLLRFSRQYRSVVRDCLEQLSDEAASLEDQGREEEAHDAIRQSELLYQLELLWNLIEILCLERAANGAVLPQLLPWISLHFPQAEEKAKAVLLEGNSDGMDPEDAPERHQDFWNAIILYLLQGRNDQARKLLRLHSQFGSMALSSLDELMRKMPMLAANTSLIDFEISWQRWQKEAVSRIEENEFGADPNLTRVASLLAGSENVFDEVVELCNSWYQWMIGKLLFSNPTVKSYDLTFYARQAITKFGGLSNMTSLDSVLLAALETDIAQIMHELCSTLDSFWFPAHLLDLLYHGEQLEGMGHGLGPATTSEDGLHQQSGARLREFLLLEYATSLMGHHSLWQVGANYLDHCPTQGKHRLQLLLERIPLDSETKAEKVIAAASKRGFVSIVTSTSKVMGLRDLKSGKIGSAMAWALRSQDVQFTTHLADLLLNHYNEEGSFSSTDLLDHLGPNMVLSDRLTFLAKYREFHRLCAGETGPAEAGEAHMAAANLLYSLLQSRLAPKYFWITLLIDTMPYLNNEGENAVIFSSEQTYEILHCLQELSKDTSLPKKQALLLREHEPHIRMLLTKNLSLALLAENDAGDRDQFGL